MSEFDHEAQCYDAHFSDTCVGIEQRRQVYQALLKDHLFNGQRVLELNCGTGIDAQAFLRKGNSLLATDASPGMLIEAQKRIPKENTFVLRLEELDSLEGDFTLLFSNFGGINCLNHAQMKSFLKSAADKLEEGGTLVLVVMGKRSIWDRFYLRLKGKKSEITRRDSNSGVEIPITGGTVTTWYYAPKELIALSTENFTVRTLKPIGLFVPPSYLAPFFDRRKRSFGFLKFMDRLFRFPRFSNFSDHYYLSLRKK